MIKGKHTIWQHERQGRQFLIFLVAALGAFLIAYVSVALLTDANWNNLEIVRMFQERFLAREGIPSK